MLNLTYKTKIISSVSQKQFFIKNISKIYKKIIRLTIFITKIKITLKFNTII